MKLPKRYSTDIEVWENMTNDICELFIRKYFGKLEDVETWWVSNEIGGTMYVNDHFFTLNDVLECLRDDVPKKEMFSYYEYLLTEPKPKYSRKHWKIWTKGQKKLSDGIHPDPVIVCEHQCSGECRRSGCNCNCGEYHESL